MYYPIYLHINSVFLGVYLLLGHLSRRVCSRILLIVKIDNECVRLRMGNGAWGREPGSGSRKPGMQTEQELGGLTQPAGDKCMSRVCSLSGGHRRHSILSMLHVVATATATATVLK